MYKKKHGGKERPLVCHCWVALSGEHETGTPPEMLLSCYFLQDPRQCDLARQTLRRSREALKMVQVARVVAGTRTVVDVEPEFPDCMGHTFPCSGHEGAVLVFEDGDTATVKCGSVSIGAIQKYFVPHKVTHFSEYVKDLEIPLGDKAATDTKLRRATIEVLSLLDHITLCAFRVLYSLTVWVGGTRWMCEPCKRAGMRSVR
jgi:hypothetical protein